MDFIHVNNYEKYFLANNPNVCRLNCFAHEGIEIKEEQKIQINKNNYARLKCLLLFTWKRLFLFIYFHIYTFLKQIVKSKKDVNEKKTLILNFGRDTLTNKKDCLP